MKQQNAFIPVRIVVAEVRPAAVLIRKDQDKAPMHWLPRSMIRIDDDKGLDGALSGEARTLHVRKWKADELGLITARDASAAVADLFGENA